MTPNPPDGDPLPSGLVPEFKSSLDPRLQLAVQNYLSEKLKAAGLTNLVAVVSLFIMVAGYVFYLTKQAISQYVTDQQSVITQLKDESKKLAEELRNLESKAGEISRREASLDDRLRSSKDRDYRDFAQSLRDRGELNGRVQAELAYVSRDELRKLTNPPEKDGFEREQFMIMQRIVKRWSATQDRWAGRVLCAFANGERRDNPTTAVMEYEITLILAIP